MVVATIGVRQVLGSGFIGVMPYIAAALYAGASGKRYGEPVHGDGRRLALQRDAPRGTSSGVLASSSRVRRLGQQQRLARARASRPARARRR